jgi:prepilin signal peptidase PulO-like enzyme (type II secretory pathway)
MDLVVAAAVGLLGGSLVNWLSDVLPITRRPTRPRCLHCGAKITWRGWFGLADASFQGARCRYCRARRGARAWIVELVAAVFTVWLYSRDPHPLPVLPGLLVGLRSC